MTAGPHLSPSPKTLLAATSLRKCFGDRRILDEVSLELAEGECILLEGANGSGKTTLINLLTGALQPDCGELHFSIGGDHRFSFAGSPKLWRRFTPDAVSALGVGRTWQDARLFGAHSVEENVLLAMRRAPLESPLAALVSTGRARREAQAIHAQCVDLLGSLGLAPKAEMPSRQLSTGEAKRLATARLVASGARLLFLDEPFAGLDQQGARDVASLLAEFAERRDIAMVVVDHGEGRKLLEPVATGRWSLSDAKLTTATVRASVERSTQWLLNRLREVSLGMRETELPGLARLLHFRLRPAIGADDLILAVDALALSRGGRPLFDGKTLSFALREGEIALLSAPNGWGKSTLLQSIAGLVEAEARDLSLCGESIVERAPHERALRGLQLLRSEGLGFRELKVPEILELAGAQGSELALSLRAAGSLSGGESRRLAIATLRPAKATLLDEPFAKLDESSTQAAFSRILGADLGAVMIAVPSTE